MRRFLTSIMLFVLAVPVAHSAPDGAQILQGCSAVIRQQEGKDLSPDETFSALFCLGYVSGVTDMVGLFPPQKDGKKLICVPPSGISNDQAIRIVVKWLSSNPETLHQTARTEIFLALAKAFPCGGQ